MAVFAVRGVARVKVPSSAAGIGAGAVTCFVNVETMLGVGLKTAYLSRQFHYAVHVLHKMHFACNCTALRGFEFCSCGRAVADASAASQSCGSQAQEQESVSHGFSLVMMGFWIFQLFHVTTFFTVRRV